MSGAKDGLRDPGRVRAWGFVRLIGFGLLAGVFAATAVGLLANERLDSGLVGVVFTIAAALGAWRGWLSIRAASRQAEYAHVLSESGPLTLRGVARALGISQEQLRRRLRHMAALRRAEPDWAKASGS